MIEAFLESLFVYYGLDWGGLIFGLCGCYLITNRNHYGFLLSATGCACGFCVAMISGQYGYILYNIILICLMMRGYFTWSRVRAPQAAE